MKSLIQSAVGVAAALSLSLAAVTATAQPYQPGHGQGMGHGMGHGMGQGMGHSNSDGSYTPMAGAIPHLTKQDAGSKADMSLVHDLLMNARKIKRTVTNLPNGIKTVTESDDPKVTQTIQTHVASMSQRLSDGRDFNIFSTTLPVLFENREKIQSNVEMTAKGAVVTRTSTDSKVVTALQGHAKEVTELAQGGMPAFHRNMSTHLAAGARGSQAGSGSAGGQTR